MAKIVRVDPQRPDPAVVKEAVEVIQTGSLVVFPTDTLYGLGADALNEEAINRVYEVKGRDFTRPLLIFIGKKEQLQSLVTFIPPPAQRLIEAFWPGPLTLVLHSSSVLPPLLLGGSSRVGIRLPASSLIRQIVLEAGAPITGTSANPSGRPTPSTAQEIQKELGGAVDLILDGGPCISERGSTLLDVTSIPPLLLREGELSAAVIEKEIGPLMVR